MQYLNHLVKAGYFAEIDAQFANWLLSKVLQPQEEQAVFLASLFWASRQGHLCLPVGEKDLFSHCGEEKEKLLSYIEKGSRAFLPLHPFVCREGKAFYLQKNWVFETRFLFHLKRVLSQSSEEILVDDDPALTAEQNRAVKRALSCPFSIISGGPGTGKSFTAAKIVEAFLKKEKGARVILAAPTGKAAQQLKRGPLSRPEVHICTVHALLGLHRESGVPLEAPPLMADLLIVDECSMLDARLFSHLLSVVQNGTRLILMGDPYQLPAVESGSLFADLVDLQNSSHHLSVLTRCLRSDREELLRFMEALLRGDIDVVLQSNYLLPWSLDQRESVYEEIKRMGEVHFPKPHRGEIDAEKLFAQLKSFALLSCLRKGPFGVDALNAELANHFMQKQKEGEKLAMPILITQSDEKQGLYNGEVGLLIRHTSREQDYAIMQSQPEKKLPVHQLPTYEYAYALSVHKSQGSEYDEVLLLVPPGSSQLGKEVIYTGVSRAKKGLKIASSPLVLREALARASRKISALHARLTE